MFQICLYVAFSALVNAAPRKMAYDCGGKIFIADLDGTQSKKIAEGACPEISPDGAERDRAVNRRCHVERSETSLIYCRRTIQN